MFAALHAYTVWPLLWDRNQCIIGSKCFINRSPSRRFAHSPEWQPKPVVRSDSFNGTPFDWRVPWATSNLTNLGTRTAAAASAGCCYLKGSNRSSQSALWNTVDTFAYLLLPVVCISDTSHPRLVSSVRGARFMPHRTTWTRPPFSLIPLTSQTSTAFFLVFNDNHAIKNLSL